MTGVLEVGITEDRMVVVNHPDLKPDANGCGHIIFSPSQARALAKLLRKKATECEIRGGDIDCNHENDGEGTCLGCGAQI